MTQPLLPPNQTASPDPLPANLVQETAHPGYARPEDPGYCTAKPLPALEVLREWFDYDPDTGDLRWKKLPSRRAKLHSLVGSVGKKGYRIVEFQGGVYRAHRIAFKLHYGRDPVGDLDHRNGIKDDNWIKNLIERGRCGNAQNRQKPHAHNSTGMLGVSVQKNRFRASLTFQGKTVYIGLFATAQEAHEAYVATKRQLHIGCEL